MVESRDKKTIKHVASLRIVEATKEKVGRRVASGLEKTWGESVRFEKSLPSKCEQCRWEKCMRRSGKSDGMC